LIALKNFTVALFFIWLAGFQTVLYGQETRISGKVTDAETGDPMPFVSVLLKGTTIGTTTDFEGNFTLQTQIKADSLMVSYLGYQTLVKAIQQGKNQVINFQMKPAATVLQAVVVRPGDYENPAWEILRGIIAHKDQYLSLIHISEPTRH